MCNKKQYKAAAALLLVPSIVFHRDTQNHWVARDLQEHRVQPMP